VGDRQGDRADALLAGRYRGSGAQAHAGRAAGGPDHLHVLPADLAQQSEPQQFRDRFLRRVTAGQVFQFAGGRRVHRRSGEFRRREQRAAPAGALGDDGETVQVQQVRADAHQNAAGPAPKRPVR
jgi:hypothetical protein